MLQDLISIAIEAGEKVLNVYSRDFASRSKDDGSPITEADIISNSIIISKLNSFYPHYPIISEELEIPTYQVRKTWKQYFLIDPLDGTKDFINKNGQFTINISLIVNSRPYIGVVYVPALDVIYYAEKGKGAFKNGEKIFNNSGARELVGTQSIFHSTASSEEFLHSLNVKKVVKYGASLKLCKLSEGEVDIYPRFNGSSEWDTAAGHAILNEAGCKMIDIETGEEIIYNKESLRNPYFVACKNEISTKIIFETIKSLSYI